MWKLFLDDQASDPSVEDWRRPPVGEEGWKVAHSSPEAMVMVDEFGPPEFISFDHDLGELEPGLEDTAMRFLRWFESAYPYAIDGMEYNIHSQNPEGAKNIQAFMDSWRRSRDM